MKEIKNTTENFPEWVLQKWQDITDILAETLGITAALIMKAENESMEVFISSQSKYNPYIAGSKTKWHGLYCETVIKTQNTLIVTNATRDKIWDHNPDLEFGMIAYLGLQINYPDNQVFGTLCVLDNKEHQFTLLNEKLLQQFKNVIELDLAVLQSIEINSSRLSAFDIQEITEQKHEEQLLKENTKFIESQNEVYHLLNKELQKKDLELRRQNELLDSLIKNLPMGVFMVEVPSGKPIIINEAAIRILGRGILPDANKQNLSEVYQSFKNDINHPYPIEETPIIKGMSGEYSSIDDMIVIRPDGVKTYLEIYGAPVKNEIGVIWASLVSFYDITNRKQSEEIFRDIIEKNPMSIQILDMDGYPILANSAHLQLFGELPPSDYSVLKDPQLAQQGFGELFDRIRKGEVVFFPDSYFNVHDVDPSFPDIPVWVKAVGFTLNDINGLPERIVLMHENISERRHAEELLNEIIENNPLSIQIVDREGCLLHGNPAYTSLFGGNPPPDFSIFDELQRKGNELEQLINLAKRGEVVHLPDMYFNPHDEVAEAPDVPLWIRALIFPLNDSGGKPERFVLIHENITERKKLEDVQNFLVTCGYSGSDENFFESLAKYLSKILNAEYVCIDKLKGDGLTAQTVAIYNEGKFDTNVSYTLKQTPCGDVVGKNICCFPENVCQLFPHDEALQELKAQGYMGTTLWSFDGKPIGLIAIISQKPIKDTAFAENVLKMVASRVAGELERNQVEDELRLAKEKAEESDKLKSAFLANMSHEIRTPMNGILGFAGLLKTPNLTGEQQKQYLSVIEKSGLRMLNIINEIIDISKIESGQMKLLVTKTNINEQIEFIYAFFKHEVEAKGMTISFKNDLPFSEAFISTDCEKLYSILTNLVKNSIKYSNVGSIEFGYFLTHQQDRNEAGLVNEPFKSELQFYVKDTGIGIPVNRQKAIFERFVQADIIDVNARQGAGLGLTITKAFVEMLGGRIWVDSEEEKGSTFYFTLPYNVQQNGKENNQITNINEVKENQNNKLKILIAEDDDDSCQLISIGVRNFGKEIITVQTGADAVDVCRNNPDIDLVLMDIQMPGMSGYEATRQIRLFNKNVIIIAQTAYALSGDKEKAFSSGCNDYISKPIRMDELLALVQKYSNKKIV